MSLYSDLNEVLTPYANKIKELDASDDQIKADLGDTKNDINSNIGRAYIGVELGKCKLTNGVVTYTTSNYGVRIPEDVTISVNKGDVITVNASIIDNASGFDIYDKTEGVLIASGVSYMNGYTFQDDYDSIAISVNSYSSLANKALTNIVCLFSTANIPYYTNWLDMVDTHLGAVDDSLDNFDAILFSKNNFNKEYTTYTTEDGYYNYLGVFTANSNWRSYVIDIGDVNAFKVHSWSYGTGCYQYIVFDAEDNIIKHGEFGDTSPTEWTEIITLPRDADRLIIVSSSQKNTEIFIFGGEPKVDKLYIAFGDSVCRGNHPDSSKSAYAWPEMFATMKNIQAQNKAIGGQGYKTTAYAVSALDTIQSTDISDADLITLSFGINDASDSSVQVGTADDVTADTMLGCVYQCIDYIYTQNPKVQLIICGTTKQNGNWYPKLKNVNEGLKSICEKYGIAFIDMSESPINQFNGTTGGSLTTDGTHFNDDGYKLLSQFMTGQLGKFFGA